MNLFYFILWLILYRMCYIWNQTNQWKEISAYTFPVYIDVKSVGVLMYDYAGSISFGIAKVALVAETRNREDIYI